MLSNTLRFSGQYHIPTDRWTEAFNALSDARVHPEKYTKDPDTDAVMSAFSGRIPYPAKKGHGFMEIRDTDDSKFEDTLNAAGISFEKLA